MYKKARVFIFLLALSSCSFGECYKTVVGGINTRYFFFELLKEDSIYNFYVFTYTKISEVNYKEELKITNAWKAGGLQILINDSISIEKRNRKYLLKSSKASKRLHLKPCKITELNELVNLSFFEKQYATDKNELLERFHSDNVTKQFSKKMEPLRYKMRDDSKEFVNEYLKIKREILMELDKK